MPVAAGTTTIDSPAAQSSPPALSATDIDAPSSSSSSLAPSPYWLKHARRIDTVVTVTAAADGASAHDSPADTTVFTRFTLHGILLFCGIKQYCVSSTADFLIAQLLSAACAASTSHAAAATPSVRVLVRRSNTATAFTSLSVRDWAGLTDAQQPSSSPSSLSSSTASLGKTCQLRVPLTLFERAVVRALGAALRGQMLCLRPLLRWKLSCAAQQRGRAPVVVFIGGTSGSGKSTLARLVASQLRIATVLSTDTVRQVLRARLIDGHQDDYPTLFVSTYEAHTVLNSQHAQDTHALYPTAGPACQGDSGNGSVHTSNSSAVLAGYTAQCEPVLRVLDGMLDRLLSRGESAVIEGVHLLPNYLATKRAELLLRRVTCVPVVVQIPKADTHLERFCIRSRGMSLKSSNKYVDAFPAIRAIQDYLITLAEQPEVTTQEAPPPLVLTNTNVDKSFLVIHHAILEAMEYTALHGWPATHAETGRVPLTPLVFTATKERLVAVVRQRRLRRATAAASRDNLLSGHSPAASPTTQCCGCGSDGVCSAGSAATFSCRARSARMPAAVHRRGSPQLHPAGRERRPLSGAAAVSGQGTTVNVPTTRPGALAALTIPAVSHLDPLAEDERCFLSDGESSPFTKAAPRRSTTTGVRSITALHNTFTTAAAAEEEEEETEEEAEVPSLTTSCTEIPSV